MRCLGTTSDVESCLVKEKGGCSQKSEKCVYSLFTEPGYLTNFHECRTGMTDDHVLFDGRTDGRTDGWMDGWCLRLVPMTGFCGFLTYLFLFPLCWVDI